VRPARAATHAPTALAATGANPAATTAELAGPPEAAGKDQSSLSVDVARVEAGGDAVIAGRAAPGATVDLLRGGERLDRAVADASGQFVMVPPRLPAGSYELTLSAKLPDGTVTSRGVAVTVNDAGPSARAMQSRAEYVPETASQPRPSSEPRLRTVPVTVDNFSRAETDMYLGKIVKDGGLGKFIHNRTPTEIDKQTVILIDRDLLYSSAVFDLDAGPVTITLPEVSKRFMSMQVIDEDHYTPLVDYKPGPMTLTKKKIGTRYVAALVRTLVDPTDPNDLDRVHALQDRIKVSQRSAGKFEVPDWDETSQKKVRDALLVLASATDSFERTFGSKAGVDPIKHLIGTAAGWGGNPDKDATYVSFTPAKNDGKTVYKVHVNDVPVDTFWSISLYNGPVFSQKNDYNLNNITAKKNADRTVDVQFGGCDGEIPNCLPIMDGWNYTVRLYRPRPKLLNGKWKFPEPQPAG
jgi:hypothetical protein